MGIVISIMGSKKSVMDCRNSDNGCRNSDNGCRKSDNGCRKSDSGCRKSDNGCRKSDSRWYFLKRIWLFRKGLYGCRITICFNSKAINLFLKRNIDKSIQKEFKPVSGFGDGEGNQVSLGKRMKVMKDLLLLLLPV